MYFGKYNDYSRCIIVINTKLWSMLTVILKYSNTAQISHQVNDSSVSLELARKNPGQSS